VGCEKWKTRCFSCPQKTDYPASWLIDRSEKNFNLKKKLFASLPNLTLVPVSNWLSGILKESYLQDYPVKVIHNGINTEVFRPSAGAAFRTKHHLEDKFILLGAASIWSTRKGLKDFISLSKLLDTNYKIVLVGLTRKQMEQLPENILGIERTESVEDLAEIYSAADIVLNLSYEETFGLTTVEGFACGTPGIVYNATASPELIDNSTGIIVEKGDIKEIRIFTRDEKKQDDMRHRLQNQKVKFYSHNTRRLDVEEMKKLLLKLPEVREDVSREL